MTDGTGEIPMQYFEYGEKELEYLIKKDKRLGAAIEKIGMIKRKITPDPFEALVSSVVGQQISGKAADTVWARLIQLCGTLSPEKLFELSAEEIQSCGMSLKKAGYIKGIAQAAISGDIYFNNLHMMSDEEIIKKLTTLKGVGEWTVEMLLIFSLGRPNIVSYKDLAICKGMMKLYGLKELPKEKFERYKKRYSPYGTVASLYLWEISTM